MESAGIKAKFLLLGDKDAQDSNVLEIVGTPELKASLTNNYAIFKILLLHASKEDIGSSLWFDMRTVYPDFTEVDAQLLINFILKYDPRPDKKAEAFNSLKEFARFEHIAQKTKLSEAFDLKMIRDEYLKQHPILILIDIGGSILYRCGEKIEKEGFTRKVDCQIKKHFHYYRPNHALYISKLVQHPRVKLGIYTSIMRKNAMPLLFKIFDEKQLRDYRKNLYDVFD
jgi:hypothetical protein